MLDSVLLVLKAVQDNPPLLNLLGLPIAALLVWAMLKGFRDGKPGDPPVLPPWGNPSAAYFQGPIERALHLLTEIRDNQHDATRTLERTQEDQLRQTSQHNAHMEDIKRLLTTSMRHDRRFGERD